MELQTKITMEMFYGKPFQATYNDEEIELGGVNFVSCTGNSCTTSTEELKKQSPAFMDTYSKYHDNYTYLNIKDVNNGYRKYNDIMTNNPLLAYRCVNKSPGEIKNLLSQNSEKFAYLYKKIFVYDESSLVAFIEKQLTNIKENAMTNCNVFDENVEGGNQVDANKYCKANMKIDLDNNRGTNKIIGPVYALISQSPYLEYHNNKLNARSDITHNRLSYYTENIINGVVQTSETTGDGSNTLMSSLYAEVLLILPMYVMGTKQNGINLITLTGDTDRMSKFESLLTSHIVNQELCYMKCNKGSLFCGCLNSKEDDMNFSNSVPFHNRPYIDGKIQLKSIQKYSSICLNNNNNPLNYSMLYFLNPYSRYKNIIMNINR